MEKNQNKEKNSENSGLKKKRMRLSYDDKKQILQKLKSSSISTVCKKYGVTERSLRRWRELEEKIMDMSQNTKTKDCKTIRDSCIELDSLITKYVSDLYKQGIIASGPMIRQEALRVNKELGGPEDFKASEGWLHKWKERQARECNSIEFGESDSHQNGVSKELTEEREGIEKREDDLRNGLSTKQTRLSYNDKKQILQKLKSRPKAIICQEYGITEKCLQKCKRIEKKIINIPQNSRTKDFKTMKNFYGELDNRMLDYVLELNQQGSALSGPLIRQEALRVNHELGLKDFKASDGRFQRWRRRKVKELDVGLRKSNHQNEQSETKHENKMQISKKLSCPETMIDQESQNTEEFLQEWIKTEVEEVVDDSQDSQVENAETIEGMCSKSMSQLLEFPSELCEQGITVSESMISQEKTEMNKELGGFEDLVSNYSWQHNFGKIQVRELDKGPGKSDSHQYSLTEEFTRETPERDNSKKNFENDMSRKKRTRLSYSDKEQILQKLDTCSKAVICQEYGVTERSLRKWKSRKKDIFDASQNLQKKHLKTIRDTCTELDNRLSNYVFELCEQGVTVSGPMIKQEALRVNKELKGPKDFKASDGWLHRWKKRNAICSLKIIGTFPLKLL